MNSKSMEKNKEICQVSGFEIIQKNIHSVRSGTEELNEPELLLLLLLLMMMLLLLLIVKKIRKFQLGPGR